jgi:hypothetical protein
MKRMATIKLNMGGKVVKVEGRRFSHYVKNVRFWFGFHKSVDHVAQYQVTHLDSGNRVCFVSHNAMLASLQDDIAAARSEIDKLVERAGADRVYAVLNSATPLPANEVAA